MAVIIGIDEVGRGCWAGPVVAAAVVLTKPIHGLRDSKKLSKMKREQLAQLIYASAHVGLGWISAQQIDSLGLGMAIKLAMQRAIAQITVEANSVIVDGNVNYLGDIPIARALTRADDSVPAVSAASIVAKVARDTYMREIALRFPDYGFEHHVGYGTSLHRQRLLEHGPCDLHRFSFKPIKAGLELAR
ncbi:ribonuclease HII [Candidatus Saccharibacteria bacterium]|nr:ribonuclease HII [Candidatus Saccharibacteria bacterium]